MIRGHNLRECWSDIILRSGKAWFEVICLSWPGACARDPPNWQLPGLGAAEWHQIVLLDTSHPLVFFIRVWSHWTGPVYYSGLHSPHEQCFYYPVLPKLVKTITWFPAVIELFGKIIVVWNWGGAQCLTTNFSLMFLQPTKIRHFALQKRVPTSPIICLGRLEYILQCT